MALVSRHIGESLTRSLSCFYEPLSNEHPPTQEEGEEGGRGSRVGIATFYHWHRPHRWPPWILYKEPEFRKQAIIWQYEQSHFILFVLYWVERFWISRTVLNSNRSVRAPSASDMTQETNLSLRGGRRSRKGKGHYGSVKFLSGSKRGFKRRLQFISEKILHY